MQRNKILISLKQLIRFGERMEELKYFAEFPQELKKYRGKHVAIIGNRVVAFGDNAIEVYKKAKEKYPDKKPVLAYVPREETLILVNK